MEEHTEELGGSFALYFETQLPWAEIPEAPDFKRVVDVGSICIKLWGAGGCTSVSGRYMGHS